MLAHQNALHFAALPLQILHGATVAFASLQRRVARLPHVGQFAGELALHAQRLLAIGARRLHLGAQRGRALVQLAAVAAQRLGGGALGVVRVAQLAVRVGQPIVLQAQRVQPLLGVLERFAQRVDGVLQSAFARERIIVDGDGDGRRGTINARARLVQADR